MLDRSGLTCCADKTFRPIAVVWFIHARIRLQVRCNITDGFKVPVTIIAEETEVSMQRAEWPSEENEQA